MRLTGLATRLAAPLAAAAALAACGGTVDIALEKDLTVDSAVAGGAITAPVDLAAESGGAWKRRRMITSISVTTAEAEITAVTTPPNTATAVSGEVWLLPEGQTSPGAGAVKVGAFSDEPVEVGHVIHLQLSSALDAFLGNAFNGTGRFVVYAKGTGAGGAEVACVLHARLGAAVKWSSV